MSKTGGLSEREIEVAELLLQGKSNKQIALALGISDHTVEFHLKNVYAKLQVSSRAEAIIKLGKSPGLVASGNLGKSAVDEHDESGHNQGELVPGRSGTPTTRMMDLRALGKLIEMNKTTLLIGILLLVILALVLSRPVLWERAEETQIAQETIIVTAEVTRLVQEPIIVISEVTPLVQEPIIVTAEVTRLVEVPVPAATEAPAIMQEVITAIPAPPYEASVSITRGVGLQVPRTMHSATRLFDGRILVVAGSDGMDGHRADAEIVDPAAGSSNWAASLNTPRHDHTATLLPDGRVLVVGGYNYQQQWLGDAEVYDVSTDTWTVVPPIYPHGIQHTATLMGDGRVLLVGGVIRSGPGDAGTDRVEIFDPQSNTWAEAMPLWESRGSHTAQLLDDGRVLIAGGATEGDRSPADGDALLYDPRTNTWTATGAMVKPRIFGQSVRLPDGRVLVAGGINLGDRQLYSPNRMMSTSAEIYDPASNRWTATADLMWGRYAHALVLMPDGQVLAIGGASDWDCCWTPESFVREIERYDPQTNRWTMAGILPQPLTFAATAILPDGRLWVSGGGAGHAIAMAWADTWLIAPLQN